MPSGRSPVVLVVDDVDDVRTFVKLVLRRAGFEVREAVNGREALRMAEDQPDLIVLDVNLPDVDGFEVCHRLKSARATASIPVLHLSAAYRTSADRTRGLDLGADAYLTQPVEPKELVASVQALLRVRRAEAEVRSVFNGALDAMVVSDDDGRCVDANPAACALFGRSQDDIIGQAMRDLVPGADFDRIWRALMEHGRTSGELRIVRPDDATRDVEYLAIAHVVACRHLAVLRDVTDRRRADRALRESESRYRALVEGSIQGMCIHRDGIIQFANATAARVLGYEDPRALVGRPMLSFVADHDRARVEADRLGRLTGRSVTPRYECQGLRHDGSLIWLECVASRVDLEGSPAILETFFDISERRQLEEQFRRAQRMEAVGHLAGGIAHDFNNLLTVIGGRSALLLARLTAADPARPEIERIRKAADRAATLTRQLLAFSRKQILQPKVFDVNTLVADMEVLLRRVIGEDVDLVVQLTPGLGSVRADPGQIEQVILNLTVNARDAMPDGGRLTIVTSNVDLDEAYAQRHPESNTGPHVMLVVSDTGTGMTVETLSHIFEPFFTTKEAGRGTGLGLAMVYGVVKQSGGAIEVESEPGGGTSFRIYLPRVPAGGGVEAPLPSAEPAAGGSETVLLVEDEPDLRELTREILAECGYTVVEASDAAEALRVSRDLTRRIDLLLTDVVMPGMNGRDLAERLRLALPHLKVLFMSGYTDTMIAQHGVLEPETPFINKPFTPDLLARKVRAVLDQTTPPDRP